MSEKIEFGISLIQPWASLLACGFKRIETRNPKWNRRGYRGWVAILASKHRTMPSPHYALMRGLLARAGLEYENLHRGGIVGYGRIVGQSVFGHTIPSWAIAPGTHELKFGDFAINRWGLYFEDAQHLDVMIPCKGMLGIFKLPEPAITLLNDPTLKKRNIR